MRSRSSNSLRHALCAVGVIALAACASGPRGFGNDAAADAQVERHVKRGYLVDHAYRTDTASDTWTIDGETIAVSLIVPQGGDRYPLVVYLPGLGETVDAGLAWRKAWAEAGYAVLAAQPASDGVAVWKSDEARLGDFNAVARTHFSATSLARRAQLLDDILAEVARRASASPALARIDSRSIAIAGFDLGAQTVMVTAGEHVEGVPAPQWPGAVKAVIALSPYADFAGMGLADNFRGVRMPVLGVTGGEDTDAYGLVTSPSVRRAPFQYMPAGDKYLLVLAGAPHSLMSGREAPDNGSQDARGNRTSANDGEQPSRTGARGRRGFAARGGSGQRSTAAASSSVNWKMELADAKGVTTAFLDATVKSDPVAREWLQKDAQRWLGDLAQLSAK